MRAFRSTFLILVFSIFAVSASAQQEFFPFVGEIKADNVNVRAGQSSNFEKLLSLSEGERVVVTDKKFSWYKIELPSAAKSFISSKYVRELAPGIGGVIGSRVNVRAGPGINHSVLGQVGAGEEIIILEVLDEEWYRIKPIRESYGWISEKFLVFESTDVAKFKDQQERVKLTQAIEVEKPKSEAAKEEVKAVEPKKAETILAKDFVSLTGVLQRAKVDRKNVRYQLEMSGQPKYYLQGLTYVGDEFKGFTVEIEGKIDDNANLTLPLIKLSKLKLVL